MSSSAPPTSAHPDPIDPDNPNDERSFTQEVKKTEQPAQEKFTLDKVFYESKIWDVKQAEYIKRKGNWILKLQVEDGSETRTVPQGNVEIFEKGPNHKES